MNEKRKYIILIIGVIAYLSVFVAGIFPKQDKEINTQKISKSINNEIFFLQSQIDKINKQLDETQNDSSLFEKLNAYKNIFNKHSAYLLLYRKDSLIYWNNNDILFSLKFPQKFLNKKLFKYGSKYLLAKSKTNKDYRIIALLTVRNEYPFENNYLENSYNKLLKIPANYNISAKNIKNSYAVKNSKGQTIFYLYKNNKDKAVFSSAFPVLIYFLSIFLIITGFYIAIANRLSFSVFAVFSLIFVIVNIFFQPEIIKQSEIFSPYLYADAEIFASLGHFILFTGLFALVGFAVSKTCTLKSKILQNLPVLFSAAGFIAFYLMIKSLVFNSNFNFFLYDLIHISKYSLIFYLSIFVLSISEFYLINTFIKSILKQNKNLKILLLSINILIIVSFFIYEKNILFPLFYVSILLIIWQIHAKYKFSQESIILLIFVASLFLSFQINSFSDIKERKQREFFALGISSNRDYVAESQLKSLEQKIKNDKKLLELSKKPVENEQAIYKYINNKFFHSYWAKYKSQITICGTNNSFENENKLVNCDFYFQSLIKKYGQNIDNTNFKHLDLKDGKIHYLNTFYFVNTDDTVSISIELVSKLSNKKLEFPKLLIPKNSHDKIINEQYSYAKYLKNKLIYESGEYFYTLNLQIPETILKSGKTFSYFDKNGYNHLVYKNGNNITLISKKHINLFSYLATFSYLFLFFLILLLIIFIITNPAYFKSIFHLNLKNTIQLSMLGILFFSLITTALTTGYLNINQTKKTHFKEISEKTQSILIELQHKFSESDSILASDYDYISYLFEKWSYVFFTDINLYNTKGKLIASSRPGISEKKIAGSIMNPDAFYKMIYKKESEFIHEENIGKLIYTASYISFLNSSNNVMAYLNLSYFSKQEIISEEISKLVVTLINIYALLFLIASIIAFFVSEKITKPLSEIKQKFSELSLEKTNTPVIYNRNDEIGELVNEYNRVINELEKSAELLARSERETAWREMAKQIAHEVKNPLTPMKLSIQFLMRAWNNNDENFDEKIRKISKTLTEQIDALSKIAGEFSDFAKTSSTQNTKINLTELIQSVITLFANRHNVNFELSSDDKKITVFADKEQIIRVFNNLIKNAIQAIPDGENGEIKIHISNKDKYARVSISDNGSGIPNDILDKLFIPNFTTKSTGTGLGLAIVKKILEQYNGKIEFETSPEGTTFYVDLLKA